jgi:hypothetical protein
VAFQLFHVFGPHAPDVADGQHGQQVQPLPRFHRLGEVAHGARVGDVALLRHVGHQQVIAHQPFDRFAFCGFQAQRGQTARAMRAPTME